jgi:hypothetical protein
MEVVVIGYVFKPKKEQVDLVAQAVTKLQAAGLNINISRFYEYAVDRALCRYRTFSEEFVSECREYLEAGKNQRGSWW